MFTGIIEDIGVVKTITENGANRVFRISCPFVLELKPDQSLAHDGVCLTVTEIADGDYSVTAIKETLEKTNLGLLKVGDNVNLERCLKLSDRMDGHWVQGHVDSTGIIEEIEDQNGSWMFTISYDDSKGIVIEKGSITLNGVSLTVVNSRRNLFSVAIIPYTFQHTTFHSLKRGDKVNIEFDLVGKYLEKIFQKSAGRA